MALETKLQQKLGQQLLMTPQLQQAIKLLQLGRLEYIEAIEKELLENPVLEELAEEGQSEQQQKEAQRDASEENFLSPTNQDSNVEGDLQKSPSVDWEDYLDKFADASGAATPKGTFDFDSRPSVESTATRGENLTEHLVSQLRFSDISQQDQKIAIQILGNLNKDGYLCVSYENIAEECGCSIEDVQRVMDVFRSFDPPGIGARNLSECLLIQLENLGLGDGLPARIVQNHLDKLERRRFDLIAKVEEVAIDEVYKAVTAIQGLEPRPGRQFFDDETRYIIPDIYISKVNGEWVITLNEEGMPKLRVSPYYLEILKKKEADNNLNRTYLNDRLKAASWLIKSIHQRQQTIYKVAESIVKYQTEFLEQGIEKLKPLVLKDVAEDIGMHESTVSRVTTNKYMHTPQGVYELKYFFSTGIKTSDGDLSSSTIKERIRNIIAAEDPKNPVSDQEVVETLKKENIPIARRTVAKYRETLNIPSSSKRKRLF